jgi:hypothetical protein
MDEKEVRGEAKEQNPRTGGLNSMHLMGVTDADGVFRGNREAAETLRRESNGNPMNMLDAVRRILGDDVLFVIQRSVNRNVVVYRLKRDAGEQVDPADPVEVFWLMIPASTQISTTGNGSSGSEDEDDDSDGSEDGAAAATATESDAPTSSGMYTEQLTRVESTLAYGVTVLLPEEKSVIRINIRALRGEPIHISSTEKAGYIAHHNRPFVVHNIMAYTEDRWGLWPTVTQTHVSGTTLQGDASILHYRV